MHLSARQETLINEALRSGAYENPGEVIDRALEILHDRDEWLMLNRAAIDGKIQRGLEELERGESIAENKLDGYLARLKALPE